MASLALKFTNEDMEFDMSIGYIGDYVGEFSGDKRLGKIQRQAIAAFEFLAKKNGSKKIQFEDARVYLGIDRRRWFDVVNTLKSRGLIKVNADSIELIEHESLNGMESIDSYNIAALADSVERIERKVDSLLKMWGA